MKISSVKTLTRLAKVAGLITLGLSFAAPAAYAQVDGGWTLNIDNAGNALATAGADVPYTFRIENNANQATPATSITFTIPPKTIFLGVEGLANCTPSPDGAELDVPLSVTCDVSALEPQEVINDVVVKLRPIDEGVIELSAKMAGLGPSQAATTTVDKGADLSVNIAFAETTVQAGFPAHFSATIRNNGPHDSDGAKFVLPLPEGLSPDVSMPSGCVIAGKDIVCLIPGSFNKDDVVTFDFSSQVIVENESTIAMTGTVEPNGKIKDPVNSNDKDTARLTVVAGTDVSLSKTRSPQGALLTGDTVTFTLQPGYAGAAPLQATIADLLPENYKFVSVSANAGWSCPVQGQSISCDYLQANGSDYRSPITIVAQAIKATDAKVGVTNTATISSPNESEGLGANNDANDGVAFITDPMVDLVAHKTGPVRNLVTVGNSYPFNLSTTNVGNIGFFGKLTITDNLPAGLTVTKIVAPSGWVCSPNSNVVGPQPIVCTTDQYTEASPFKPGVTTPQIELTAEVTAEGEFANSMLVSFDGYKDFDANPADNTVTTGIITSADKDRSADISINKTIVGSQTVKAGDEITFKIEVVNSGLATAVDVKVQDRLNEIVAGANGGKPDDVKFSFLPGIAQGMSCRADVTGAFSRDLLCDIDTLPVCTTGSCPVILVTVHPGDEGSKINSANAFSIKTPDNNLTNNESSVSYNVLPQTDVTVTKTSPSAVGGARAGQEMVYDLTAIVPNSGLSSAENVTITDTLPNGLRFVSANPSTGSCTTVPAAGSITTSENNQLVCNLGTIKNGSQQTVTVTVIPTTPVVGQTLINKVDIATTTQENNKTNNSVTLPVTILKPELDLVITKSDDVDPVEIGQDTTYTVTVINRGPSDSSNLVITDTLPSAGFANPVVVEEIGGGSTFTLTGHHQTTPGGVLTYNVPYLKAGATVVFKLKMTSVARGKYSNAVEVTSDETEAGYEQITVNNKAVQDTTVRVRSDLLVEKVASVTKVDLREEFSWKITVHNKKAPGLDVAELVTLEDMLPVGMELTALPVASVGTCTGTIGGRAISCELGDIQTGDTVTVTLKTKITDISAESASNTATAETLSFEADPKDNTSTGSVNTVLGSSISGTIYRDFNNNDNKDTTDTGISGIAVTVTGKATHDGVTITRTVSTGADGQYSFDQLPPGTYSVVYGTIGEKHLVDGKALPAANDLGVAAPAAPTANGVNGINGIVITSTFEAVKHDFTRVPVARIGIGKTVGTPVVQADGSFHLPYTLTVKNYSLEPVTGINVTDHLAGATQNFGTYNGTGNLLEGQYRIFPVGGSFETIQSGFNGSGNDTVVSNGTLAAGATGTLTYTVHVKPAVPRVVPALIYTNQATVTGTGGLSGQPVTDLSNNTDNPDPDGNGIPNEPANNNPTTVAPIPAPAITLTKTATPLRTSGAAEIGDRINYNFTITNTGNTPLVNVKLTDLMAGLEGLPDITITRLDPGQLDSTSYTAFYILTQDDLDNGLVENTANVIGQWGINGSTPVTVEDSASASVPALSNPGLTIVKTRDSDTVGNPRTVVGDTIRYAFTVTNTGNTILRNVTVSDTLAGITQSPASSFTIGTLNPGDARTVYADYDVTLLNIDAGKVDNVATANGVYGPTDKPVTTTPSDVTVPLFRQPSVTLTKVLSGAAPENPRVGDLLTWTVTATNTGNVTLTNLVVTDPFVGAVVTPSSLAALAPAATFDFTVTAPLKQTDINAGEARNTAQIDATTPTGPLPPVESEEVVTPLPQKPLIALKKTGDATAVSNPPKVGELITYTMVIRNTGNVPLNNITLTDELPDFILNADDAQSLSTITLQPKTPDNADSDTEITVSGTYALKTSDIDAGSVTNIAETTGTSTVNPDETVTDTSGTDFDNDNPVVTDLEHEPKIRLVKTITDAALSTPPVVGDIITYGFAIHNTGNVTLTNIRLEDQVGGVTVQNTSGWTGPLIAGGVNTDAFTATYALTQDDIDKGVFANTAIVTGSSVDDTDVTDTSGTDIDNNTPTEQPLDKVTGLSIVKSESAALSTPPTPGDIITYSFVVTNTGNVTLTDVIVTDPLPDLVMPVTTIAKLLPGADNAITLTATYEVKQSDIQKGEVRNQASVTGTYTDPSTNVPETVPPVDSNEIVVPLDQVPAIAVVKSAASGLTEPAEEGQIITYTFDVTNTGNMELTGVTIEDPLAGITPSSFAVGALAPGETQSFTATYAITLDDIDNEQVINQATATGTYDDGTGPKTVTDLSGPDIETDELVVVPVVPPVPELTILKTGTWNDANGNGYPEVGETIDYTFLITNTGNAILFNVRPADTGPSFNNKAASNKLSAFTPDPVTLHPKSSQEFTATYVMTQEDIDAAAGIVSAVANTATAQGNVRSGTEYESPESVVKVTLPATEPTDVVITKQAMLRQIKRGEKVPYIIRVENGSTSNAGPVNVIDTMPSGFRYVEDSATVDGNAFVPVVSGRQIRFDNLRLGPKATLEIRVDLLALSTAGPGKHTNVASVTDAGGTPIAKDATAVVEIVAEPVFDCGDIVGKVFDDKNRNGYQDEGEPGLAGVRIATAKGWLVTTDEHGRFHVACAALPDQRIGSNFIMKLDTRTLPSGYRLTTENPRVVRLTAGKMTKLNFGASIGRVVRLDVKDDAFEAGSTELKRLWSDNITALIGVLRKEPSVLRLSYIDANTAPELAKKRIRQLRDLITERWRKDGAQYQLEIETRLEVGK